jgi:hypothetical protein
MRTDATLTIVVVTLIVSSCARVDRPVQTVSSQAAPAATGECISDLGAPPSINGIVNGSDAGVVAHVDGVSPPKWNSTDGQRFERGDPSGVAPWTYRDATVTVKEVLWQTPKVETSPGETLQVRIQGAGTATGCMVEIGPGERVREDQLSGPVSAGTDVLWILRVRPFAFKDGNRMKSESSLMIAGYFDGNWKIENGSAVSLSKARSVPYDALVNRLRAERARGMHPEDRSGQEDPLETAAPTDANGK